jgi:hypothetical protein
MAGMNGTDGSSNFGDLVLEEVPSSVVEFMELIVATAVIVGACVASCVLPEKRPTSSAHNRFICVLWYVCFPLILVGHSLRIYVLPCLLSYAIGTCGKLWLWVGAKLCCCLNCGCFRRMSCCICFKFDDVKFPPCAESLGPVEGVDATDVEWKRGGEIFEAGRGGDDASEGEQARLFAGEIEPNDIGQGQLGDCWLLTAFVCLAEFPGAIQSVFLTNEFNPRGRYVIKLFNGYTHSYEELQIDDYIPVTKGCEPLFAKPNDRELWVLLLEKAFAKLLGSYHKLDGGYSLWGLQALTGDEVSNWRLEKGGSWGEYEIRYKDSLSEINFYKRIIDGKHSTTSGSAEFFEKLEQWDSEECVLAASTSGHDTTQEGDTTSTHGLVAGHAYALTTVKKVGSHRMLRLRNPWGQFEWDGDWSDSSPLWKKHGDVCRACEGGGEAADDGFFWMEFTDFCTHFQSVDVCHRSRGIRCACCVFNLGAAVRALQTSLRLLLLLLTRHGAFAHSDVRLDVHEDAGCKGPTIGCTL